MKRLMIAGLILLAGCGPYTLSTLEVNTAELGARDYADRDGAKFISCSGQDSDGDKYVTCTIKEAAGADKAVLCSYETKGCKPK